MKNASRKRSELLSVKVTSSEKARVLKAAQRMGLQSYSEFIRMVTLGACANLGIEEGETPDPPIRDVPRSETCGAESGGAGQAA